MTHLGRRVRAGLLAAAVAFSADVARPGPARAEPAPEDLAGIPLADLMNYRITSVSKQEEEVSAAAAAIYVITQEDIRRSGLRSIPELLRLVPGVQVARVTGNGWAVSARGFNATFAGNLLVLIDGRIVYTPLFSGVYWDVQDTLLEDVDRIEVIRGPGATLWGANAVNGVVNIVTKRASETRGLLATGGGGSLDRGSAGVRYGGRLGDGADYRAYFKYLSRGELDDFEGVDAHDGTETFRGGWRLDWDVGERDSLTFQGDLYAGEHDATVASASFFPPPATSSLVEDTTDVSGGNALLRWSRELWRDSDLSLQLYYDRAVREALALDEENDTWDVELQHRAPLPADANLVWGLGYRRVQDDIGSGTILSFADERRADDLLSGFVQGQLPLLGERLVLTAGTKIERNDYSGWEMQPSGRFAYTPQRGHTFWGAVSRAIRSPSRFDEDSDLRFVIPNPGFPLVARQVGSDGLDAEDLLAFELGYRMHGSERVWLDVAAFYNLYDDLVGVAPVPGPPPPGVTFQTRFVNAEEARSCGVEVASGWQVVDAWRLDASYSFFEVDFDRTGVGEAVSATPSERKSPRHQAVLRSRLTLPHRVELDAALFYVSRIPSVDVPSYLRADLRLGWSLGENVALSIAGQNLLDGSHLEWNAVEVPASRVPRSVHASATLRF